MKKNIFVSVLISLSSYVAYIGSNGELHNIIEILQGFGILVVGQSLVLILLSYLLQYKNIPAYFMFIPIIVIMLLRRLWHIDWNWVDSIGLVAYAMEVKIISVVVIVGLSLKLAARFKDKLMNIAIIFVVAGLFAYYNKAYDKIIQAYNVHNIVSSQQFKNQINQKIQVQQQNAEFSNRFNVYHILIDSYPNKQRLKQMLDLDLQPFYDELDRIGFNTYEVAYSTGSNTAETLNAMFNMGYDRQYYEYSYYGINKVFLTFLSQGYKAFCDYPCNSHFGNIGNWNKNILHSGGGKKLFIWRNFINYYLGRMFPIFTADDKATYQSFNNAINTMNQQDNYFVYMHESNHPGWLNKDVMERKLNYAMGVIKNIVNNDKNAIIILSSDHGSRSEWNNFKNHATAEALFSIIQAVKFPPQCQSFNNIPILSSVNYYKYVFACLRGQTEVNDLQPNWSLKDGGLDDFWNDRNDPNVYIYIEDNKILSQPQILP